MRNENSLKQGGPSGSREGKENDDRRGE